MFWLHGLYELSAQCFSKKNLVISIVTMSTKKLADQVSFFVSEREEVFDVYCDSSVSHNGTLLQKTYLIFSLELDAQHG